MLAVVLAGAVAALVALLPVVAVGAAAVVVGTRRFVWQVQTGSACGRAFRFVCGGHSYFEQAVAGSQFVQT